MTQHLFPQLTVARIDAYLDDATEPFTTIVPPAALNLDTTTLDDGEHVLRLRALDALGNVGRRTIPFSVQNGPGITVTGLRAGERVSGILEVEVNAFSGNEPFDPIRAESSGPIPVWAWVLCAAIGGWALWYGLAATIPPEYYQNTPTYELKPVAMATVAASPPAATAASNGKSTAAFNYAANGPQLYAANCAACHGASGAGVPGAFPPLAGDSVVTATSPDEHIRIVLHGIAGKRIGSTAYGGRMPAFAQLSDTEIAAIVDHERTSWGNHAPVVTPDIVKRAR